MPHREPTIRSRELGDGLRQSMEEAGLTGKQAAQTLGVSPSFVSMLLSGKRRAHHCSVGGGPRHADTTASRARLQLR